jgi:hypothetical protein
MQLGELEGAVCVFDVAQDAAGADRGELLIISNQSDVRTACERKLDGGVEGQGVGHSGFVDDHQCRWPNCCRPVRQVAVVQGPGELGERVGADPGLLCEDGGRGSRWSEADHMAAVLGPRQDKGAHSCCFPSARGGDRELQTCPGSAHLADQCRLPSIECSAVRRHFEQGQVDRRRLDGRTAATSRRRDETGLGVDDPLRGVEVGAGDGVNRRPVDPPQHLGFLDAVVRRGQGNRATIEHLIDEQVHQGTRPFCRHAGRADLPLCFGPDMPHLPGRPTRLHNGQNVISRLCHPV